MKQILKALVPSKAPSEPGLGERYGAALALHGAATSIFKAAHDDLVQAEAELSAVAQDAIRQIDEATEAHHEARNRLDAQHAAKVADLAEIRDMAYDDAYRAYERADKIRPLVA